MTLLGLCLILPPVGWGWEVGPVVSASERLRLIRSVIHSPPHLQTCTAVAYQVSVAVVAADICKCSHLSWGARARAMA